MKVVNENNGAQQNKARNRTYILLFLLTVNLSKWIRSQLAFFFCINRFKCTIVLVTEEKL